VDVREPGGDPYHRLLAVDPHRNRQLAHVSPEPAAPRPVARPDQQLRFAVGEAGGRGVDAELEAPRRGVRGAAAGKISGEAFVEEHLLAAGVLQGDADIPQPGALVGELERHVPTRSADHQRRRTFDQRRAAFGPEPGDAAESQDEDQQDETQPTPSGHESPPSPSH
jgi:hypothetical protein